MNATDARTIGTTAVTAAVVSILTVVVYEGHVRVSKPGQQTVVVAPGSTYQSVPKPPKLDDAPVVGGTVTTCNAEALKEKGLEHVNHGEHADALAAFEDSLACAHDAYVVQLAFMESCSSRNSDKAKQYYKQLSPAQQQKFAQMCIRTKVDFVDERDPTACEEVSCVFTNYEGACCQKLLAKSRGALDRAAIAEGIAKVKPAIKACADRDDVGGTVKMKVVVNPYGRVSYAIVDTADSEKLGACIADVLLDAQFAKTRNGATFTYPFVFGAAKGASATKCDAEALKDQGLQLINEGQHRAALAKLEAAHKCKPDAYVRQLAFMASCAAHDEAKAKYWYKQLTTEQQQKFAQLCIRSRVPYE